MSIRRIESAYATYFGDKRISGTQMSVLLALAYVANQNRNEACYPSYPYLKELTHFKVPSVKKACNALKALKIIDWESGGKGRKGGNISNRYWFCFPHKKMPSIYERYQPLAAEQTAGTSASQGEAPMASGDLPSASGNLPSATTHPTLCYQIAANTEGTPKKTSEPKSEVTLVTTSGAFDGVLKKSVSFIPPPQRQYPLLVQLALKACKVSDTHNANTFNKIIGKLDPNVATDIIFAFASEVEKGEHAGADSLPRVLMSKLKARLK